MRDLWIRRTCRAVLAVLFLISIGFHLGSLLNPEATAAYWQGNPLSVLIWFILLVCICTLFLSSTRPSRRAGLTLPSSGFRRYLFLALALLPAWYLISWSLLLLADRRLAAEDLPVYVLLIATPPLLILMYGAVTTQLPALRWRAIYTHRLFTLPPGWTVLLWIGSFLLILVLIVRVVALLFPHAPSAAEEPVFQLRSSTATTAFFCFQWLTWNMDSRQTGPAPAGSLPPGAGSRRITQRLD